LAPGVFERGCDALLVVAVAMETIEVVKTTICRCHGDRFPLLTRAIFKQSVQ